MRALLLSRVTAVWAPLVAAPLLSWELGHGLGFNSARSAGIAILVVTFIKVRMVMLDFMELRQAPRWMRLAAEAWVLGIAALLVGLFVRGSQERPVHRMSSRAWPAPTNVEGLQVRALPAIDLRRIFPSSPAPHAAPQRWAAARACRPPPAARATARG